MKQRLYFLAILPPDEIAQKVQLIKKEFVEKYNSKEAYTRPAHFTLQKPFKRPEQSEELIKSKLNSFAEERHPFSVKLSGFNHFRNKVIYIEVDDPSQMKFFRSQLIDFLQNRLDFTDQMIGRKDFTPHMTVAYRDLSPENFRLAWNEFSNRTLDFTFSVKSFFLMKHDSKNWQPFHQFNFGKR